MKLSEFELDVMQIFWEKGTSSSPEVFKCIHEEKDVAYSTVKTIIDRLESKGAIVRKRIEGRAIYYAPMVEKSAITQELLPSFLKRFFNGKPSNLIAHLMKDEKLSQDDITYLETFLAKQKKKNKDEL
ncbi:MAG: BlaI/MecI/CopY family transcriptional regulator [Alteromonadaceae bacterium]|nr:BlaI/MecI/CopY family transcriptional regulator [Alteromonadaceae bacterium]